MTGGRSPGWRVERSTGSVTSLLAPWPAPENQGDAVVRAARVGGRPALVLGSTQDRTLVDEDGAARAGVDVVRRSTGGGAVLVAPDAQVWLDLWVPGGHDLWDDDVIEAAAWVGDSWCRALRSLGVGPLRVHRGRMIRTAWSDRLCFAGFGPGEISVVVDGRRQEVRSESTGPKLMGPMAGPKVMGLAQRRTRAGARFHASAPLWWDPDPLLALFKTDAPEAAAPSAMLTSVAVGLRAIVPTVEPAPSGADLIAAVEQAVITALP